MSDPDPRVPGPPRLRDITEFHPEWATQAFEGTFPGHLGIEILELAPDRVVGRMAVDDRHLHPGMYVHGGVWVAFADTVAAWGTMANLPDRWNFTTAEMKVNVMGAGRAGDLLDAVGEPLHVGKSTQVWEVRVTKAGKLMANFICTQMVLHPKDPPA